MKWMFSFVFVLAMFNGYCGSVDSVFVRSNIMNKNIHHTIILPNAYANSGQAFKVLYLLHGYGGYHSNWYKRMPELKEYADTFNLIIVCPDGENSWYIDSPVDSGIRYESFISKELIEYIDNNYETISKKEGRLIAGLSMGGHGALYLAFRHPQLWYACAGLSGGVDFRPFYKNWQLPSLLGDFITYKPYWDQHVVVNNLPKQSDSLDIYIDCGKQDFFLKVNQSLHQKLKKNSILHTYVEHPGAHNWKYWNRAILRFLRSLEEV